MRGSATIAIACLVAAAVPCGAAQHTVRPDGLGDYPTIQAAVTAVAAGDTIVLTDGTFAGDGNRDIDFGGKDLVVQSQSDDAALCVIDCGGSFSEPHRGFNFQTGETGSSQIVAVTVRNGFADSGATVDGGGIRVSGASPAFKRCVITECEAPVGKGGGVASLGSGHPSLNSCIVSDCRADGYGGGVSVHIGDITLYSCTLMGNETSNAGGGLYVQTSLNSVVVDCVIAGNTADSGGGVRIGSSGLVLENCLIWGNTAPAIVAGGGGGGVLLSAGGLLGCTVVANTTGGLGGGVLCKYESSAPLTDCLIADNNGVAGLACYEATDSLILTCCDVHGNVGGEYGQNMTDQTGVNGNISEDPLFCNSAGFDYTLDAASPCLSDNNTCGVLMGARGEGCDSPVERTTWGATKALFRR